MIIAAKYSFNDGDSIKDSHPNLLNEVGMIIASVDATECKTKKSEELTMAGKSLYSPRDLNDAFAAAFEAKGWKKRSA